MVVYDLHIRRSGRRKTKADPKLIVYSNAVSSGAVTPQRFQAVPRRHAQVFKSARDFQLPQFPSRNRFDTGETSYPPAFRQGFRIGILERNDHAGIVAQGVINVKRDMFDVRIGLGPAVS
jgi:hypothetical protein